jgi:hypothetical protein
LLTSVAKHYRLLGRQGRVDGAFIPVLRQFQITLLVRNVAQTIQHQGLHRRVIRLAGKLEDGLIAAYRFGEAAVSIVECCQGKHGIHAFRFRQLGIVSLFLQAGL